MEMWWPTFVAGASTGVASTVLLLMIAGAIFGDQA